MRGSCITLTVTLVCGLDRDHSIVGVSSLRRALVPRIMQLNTINAGTPFFGELIGADRPTAFSVNRGPQESTRSFERGTNDQQSLFLASKKNQHSIPIPFYGPLTSYTLNHEQPAAASGPFGHLSRNGRQCQRCRPSDFPTAEQPAGTTTAPASTRRKQGRRRTHGSNLKRKQTAKVTG